MMKFLIFKSLHLVTALPCGIVVDWAVLFEDSLTNITPLVTLKILSSQKGQDWLDNEGLRGRDEVGEGSLQGG